MIPKFVEKVLSGLRKPNQMQPRVAKHPQLAMPQRVDLPLRERSHATAALPANINGAHMGTGKL